MILCYVMSNVGNTYIMRIMQIFIIKHKLVKETCKKL